ncbi:Uncharacterized protein SCF082_LOCUS42681 [Durusdinium trenchii]|uniref:Ubiquitin-like domain-containing protein n=1 Tax=Durusdinium trenchii TaxID=1381693 RepID=A0ABP0QQH3_9DINO
MAKEGHKWKVMGVLRPVHVLLLSGEAVPCDPQPYRTVRDLREEVQKKLKLQDTEIQLIASAGDKLRDEMTLSEANVDYGKYDLQDPQQLIQFLLDANIALVRLEYLQELVAAGRKFLRRQEAEGEFTAAGLPALVQASELQKLEIDPLGNMSLFVKDPSPRRVTVVIESISHAWESMEHPDPHGFQLDQIIQRCPTITSTRSVWLFYDFMSLYQYGGRTPPQEGYFRQALEQMHTLYAHEAIKVRIVDELTPETWKHPGTVMVFLDQAGGVIAVSIDQLRANSLSQRGLGLAEFGKDIVKEADEVEAKFRSTFGHVERLTRQRWVDVLTTAGIAFEDANVLLKDCDQHISVASFFDLLRGKTAIPEANSTLRDQVEAPFMSTGLGLDGLFTQQRWIGILTAIGCRPEDARILLKDWEPAEYISVRSFCDLLCKPVVPEEDCGGH